YVTYPSVRLRSDGETSDLVSFPTRRSSDLKMGEVGERERGVADLPPQLADLLMRQLQEFIEQAELIEDLQRRRMDGVAAKIAKEIGVFLKDFHDFRGDTIHPST